MWVQAWQIPVQWLLAEIVWKLGQIFNQYHNVVIPKNGSKEGRHAKLLVEVDLHKLLIWGTRLTCNGEIRWVTFKYEQLPYFWFYCELIGHGEKICERKKNDSKYSRLIED